ncbi:MAG: LPXTG cell wall anchor domain-containing protein, partial [Propionibacteriaceae bacterium]|nr:LPXTG cell wall anchor domain-containing protein [Propionibacteriaceae bacterium]
PTPQPTAEPTAKPSVKPSATPGVKPPVAGGDPNGKRPLPRTGGEAAALPLLVSLLAAGAVAAGFARRRR